MLTCIARSKQPTEDSSAMDLDNSSEKPKSNDTPTKQAIKSLSTQIKDMALKASGAYRHCAPCATQPVPQQQQQRRIGSYGGAELDSVPLDKFRWSYRRTGSSNSSSAGRRELEARLKGISSGEGTPASASGRRVDPVVFVEESEPKEWVAQVLLKDAYSLSLNYSNDNIDNLETEPWKRKQGREMFNKWQAQRWWAENCEKVMELYNVQRLNRQAIPFPSTPRSEDASSSSKMDSVEHSPVTPPLGREPPPHTNGKAGTAYSSSDSLDHQSVHSCGVASTPKLSSISATTKTETSSMDASMRTSSSRDVDRSGDISISNASDLETEWVEQDEPGVYITLRALPDGRRELRRVRFSREKFGEMHARVWWEENRARVHKQYL